MLRVAPASDTLTLALRAWTGWDPNDEATGAAWRQAGGSCLCGRWATAVSRRLIPRTPSVKTVRPN
jgi:hypothetical protein